MQSIKELQWELKLYRSHLEKRNNESEELDIFIKKFRKIANHVLTIEKSFTFQNNKQLNYNNIANYKQAASLQPPSDQTPKITSISSDLQFIQKKQQAKFRKKFLNRLLRNVQEYGALYDLDINQGYNLTVMVKIIKKKILLVTIQLGDLFPLDYVKVVTKKFQEATGQSFTSVNQLVQRKIYCYEANGEKVKNFKDEELHVTWAADILQFMKEIIEDLNSKEGRNPSYF